MKVHIFLIFKSAGVIYTAAMRHLRYVPFAFLAGAHGFALFAPYLAVALAAAHLLRRRLRQKRLLAVHS